MRFCLLLFIALWSSVTFSQNKKLLINGIGGLKINYKSIVKDSAEAKKVTQNVLNELFEMGYLSARIDSFKFKKTVFQSFVSSSEQIKWAQLKLDSSAKNLLEATGLSEATFNNRKFNATQLNRFYKRIIQFYENNGHPFAAVQLSDVMFNEQKSISANLKIQLNQAYTLDSLVVLGNSGINKTYLLKYFGLTEGAPYSEEKISAIQSRAREIPFIALKKSPQVQFFENSVKVVITVDKKKSSRFDGVIGLLTNENTGRIELTGDVDLQLVNSLNKGESLGLTWRKLKGNSQDLHVTGNYPYLLKTPLGAALDFKLFKRDTTFIDLESKVGINYILERGDFVSLFIQNKSSNLLSRSEFEGTSTLPALGDVRINSFGIEYSGNKTNYKYNPTKGINLRVNFSAGRKELQKISFIEDESPQLYDSINLITNQLNGNLLLEYYLPLAERSTLKLANQSATLYSERIYTNELLRIGGLRTFRGFDEESINASSFSIFTLEYRFLLDRNSYFSAFADYGWYENNAASNEYVSDTPFGVGAGVSFETKAGIFTFNYAIGSQMGNALNVRAAKIHFGFINFF